MLKGSPKDLLPHESYKWHMVGWGLVTDFALGLRNLTLHFWSTGSMDECNDFL